VEEQKQAYPRSSAFEALLVKVYLEMWELQDNPTLFAARVERFARVWLPSMFQNKIEEKFPDCYEEMKKMENRVSLLEKARASADPFVKEAIDASSIPAEEARFAEDVWHAIIDVLTEAGFNFPLERYMGFFDPSGGRKSGTGERKGFPAKLPDTVL